MNKDTRNAIERATQRSRKLIEEDFFSQLEGTFDVLRSGAIGAMGGAHLSARQDFQRDRIVAAVEHKCAAGMTAAEAVKDYVRDAAFTTLNRFVALKMLEARQLVQECISRGEQSVGYREFCGMAPGLALLPDAAGYRLYVESLFDELSTEVKVLFDRRDVASALWPKRQPFEALLDVLNAPDLDGIWSEDESIGWVYQYFNSSDERREMRESQAPQTSRELAVRNQFFTPRYVVDFLVQNTLAALWIEMTEGRSLLKELPLLLPRTVPQPRLRKDPRDIRVLDPACGSGHFLLSCFDVFASIYREAWADDDGPKSLHTGRTLREDFQSRADLERHLPRLVLLHNLYGIDIDARCAQIAALALWMRAQRAWNESTLARAERPSIDRTNIVIAEPLPAGRDTREAFISGLDSKLGRVAEALFMRLDLAGEAGSLLEIHEWFRSEIRQALGDFGELFAQSDDERWREAESLLLEKLRVFAAEANTKREWQRSLFAADAVRGLAFIDTTRESFDVVLMNPPFGDPTTRARSACGPELAIAANDIGGAFVLAAERRWAPQGVVGVLSSTTLWFKPTAAKWRKATLLTGSHALEAAAHLGGQVLDGAKVSASAITLWPLLPGQRTSATFLRMPLEEDKEARLYELVDRMRKGTGDSHSYVVDLQSLATYRGAPLAYWISPGLGTRLGTLPALEGSGAEVRQGVACADDPRFVRAWWELPADRVGQGRPWVPFAKSSEFSPYWDDITWVVRWENDGREVRAFDRSRPQNHSYFGRAGVTYPARSYLGFNPRAFPNDCGFGHMGSVAFPIGCDAAALLGFLSSRPLEYVLSFSNGSLQGDLRAFPNHYEVGQIKDLPWVNPIPETCERLSKLGNALATAAMHLQDDDETTHQYLGQAKLASFGSVRKALESSTRERLRNLEVARDARRRLDELVALELGFDRDDIREMEVEFDRCVAPTTGPWSSGTHAITKEALQREAAQIASALFGFAIGRLDVRPAVAGVSPRGRDSAFDGLPATGPAHVSGALPADYPIPVPGDGILTVDDGSSRDVGKAVARVAGAIWKDRASAVEEDLAALLEVETLRAYFVGKGSRHFFGDHQARYSKGRRTAPIYWQLATPSASYSVWLYLHAFTKDTLYKVRNDSVAPKLSHEERQLESMRAQFGASPKATERTRLAEQAAFVEELRAFLEDVKSVAPLWNPDFDDGVVINFAPLWRLVPQHKAWQKELKTTWDALCVGEYDWAHLAMHLWPERVVPKCAVDRSLAIAHGIEDVFWTESDDGKWKPRPTPRRSLDDVVRERSSAAVKAAITALLEVSALTAGAGRGRGRRAVNVAAD